MKKIYLCLFCICICVGCSSVDSIKLGGGYTDSDGTKIEGDVEVVLSKEESAYTGLDILESVENPSEKYIVLSQKDVKKIIDKIEPEKKTLSISPTKHLSEFLKDK